jgi:hypothetical protein
VMKGESKINSMESGCLKKDGEKEERVENI